MASDRPIAPLPVPRSAHTIGRSIERAWCNATSTDTLRLGPRDQHPAVHHQVEVPETPTAEHVLQRLTGGVASEHRVEVGDTSLRLPAARGPP
jgi:hypothetical protein